MTSHKTTRSTTRFSNQTHAACCHGSVTWARAIIKSRFISGMLFVISKICLAYSCCPEPRGFFFGQGSTFAPSCNTSILRTVQIWCKYHYFNDFASARMVATAGPFIGNPGPVSCVFPHKTFAANLMILLFHGFICVYVSFSARVLAYPIHDIQNHEETSTLKPRP